MAHAPSNAPIGRTKRSVAGGLGVVLFGLVFAGCGGLFTVLMGHEGWQSLRKYRWNEQTCRVSSCAVSTQARDFILAVELEACAHGECVPVTHTERGFSSRTAALARAARFAAGTSVTCYADPADPRQVVLERGRSIWIFAFAGLPLLFVLIGGGLVWHTLRPAPQTERKQAEPGRAGNPVPVRVVGTLFAGTFAAAGTLMATQTIAKPLGAALVPRWTAASCHVLSSEVGRHDGEDGPTYSIDLLYEYEFAGKAYHGDHYDLSGFGSSSGQGDKARIVAAHPPGSRVACWVDAAQPARSVIEKDVPASIWVMVLFSIPFLLVGYGGLGLVWFGDGTWLGMRRKAKADPGPATGGFVRLAPDKAPFASFAGLAFVAVFWNSIVGVFVLLALDSVVSGDPEWFLICFITPFAAIGAVMAYKAAKALVVVTDPRPIVEVDSARAHLGGSLAVRCRLTGGRRVPRELTLALTGREHATYRRGTDSITDTEIFFTEPLHRVVPRTRDERVTCSASIPAESMHTFEAEHNRIEWAITVKLDLGRSAPSELSFPVEIKPQRRWGGR